MKKQLFALTALFAGLAYANLALAQNDNPTAPKDVPVAVSDVFIPEGKTSNDEITIVVSGIFPNSCYKWKGTNFKDVDTFNHLVEARALVTQGMCLMVLVPYTKASNLGKLPAGNHTLRFVNGDGTYMERTLTIL